MQVSFEVISVTIDDENEDGDPGYIARIYIQSAAEARAIASRLGMDVVIEMPERPERLLYAYVPTEVEALNQPDPVPPKKKPPGKGSK
jgi:hypothetical protein